MSSSDVCTATKVLPLPVAMMTCVRRPADGSGAPAGSSSSRTAATTASDWCSRKGFSICVSHSLSVGRGFQAGAAAVQLTPKAPRWRRVRSGGATARSAAVAAHRAYVGEIPRRRAAAWQPRSARAASEGRRQARADWPAAGSARKTTAATARPCRWAWTTRPRRTRASTLVEFPVKSNVFWLADAGFSSVGSGRELQARGPAFLPGRCCADPRDGTWVPPTALTGASGEPSKPGRTSLCRSRSPCSVTRPQTGGTGWPRRPPRPSP